MSDKLKIIDMVSIKNEDCQERIDHCYHDKLCGNTSEILHTELCVKPSPIYKNPPDTCVVGLLTR